MTTPYRDVIIYRVNRHQWRVTVWAGDEEGIHGLIFRKVVRGKRNMRILRDEMKKKYNVSN